MSFERLRRGRAPIAFVSLAGFMFALGLQRPAFAEEPVDVEVHAADLGVHEVEKMSEATPSVSGVAAEGKAAGEAKAPEATDHAGAIPKPSDENATPSAGQAASHATPWGTQPLSLPTGGDKTGVSSQAISVPQGSGKIQGMGESFSAQLSTGIATFSVPFALPSARGDAQPSLGLSYSSAGAHGIAGVGWELGAPYIARQTDRGLPRYADPDGVAWNPEQDRFVFNGGQELVPICLVSEHVCDGAIPGEIMPAWANGWRYFRPRVEGSFQRFFWSKDHTTWRVQDKSGVTMELGGEANALEADPAHPTNVFRWNLSREYDAHVEADPAPGADPRPVNVVAFRYLRLGSASYLSDIYDTPPRAGAARAALSAYAHHTHLEYEARPDSTVSYRRGWPVTSALRLVRVDVASKTFDGNSSSPREMVRRYHLTYDANSHVSLLTSVQMEGRCAAGSNPVESAELLPSSACPRLPKMTFGYQHVAAYDTKGDPSVADLPGYEGFDERVHLMEASPPHSVDEDVTDLFDVNSDALPDVLVTSPALFGGDHGVYFNGADGAADTFVPGTVPVVGVGGATAGTITLKNLNVAALDLDGDSKVDLLHMPMVKTYAVYSAVGSGTSYSLQGRQIATADLLNPKIDFGRDASDLRVLDVNGDGLVDVVRSIGTEYATFLSLGRYPGGDGRFGWAQWTGPTTANISSDPLRACIPASGSPVRFSDPEVRVGDMNGDGLPDIVKIQKGNIQYWPGRGDGHWGTGPLDDCPAGTFGDHRDVAMTSSPMFTEPDASALRLDDVNGDGLDDLVQVRFTDVDIWLNVDGFGWTDRHTIAGTPPAPGYAPRVRLVDMNGSGTRDVLWGDGGNYRYIDLAGGQRPWLLTSVDNGLGKTTELEYASSTSLMVAAAKTARWKSTTPMPIHVVVRETERDNLALVGRPAGAYVTEYTYRDPVYDGLQREFRGFEYVEVKRIGDDNSPTSITSSRFLLGQCKAEDPKSVPHRCEFSESWRDNPREALKGLPVVSETFDESRSVYLSTVHHTYTLRQLYKGLDGRVVRVAFESQGDQLLYDTGAFVPDTMKNGFTDVVLDGVGEDTRSDLPFRSVQGMARLQTWTFVDYFGNRTYAADLGCIDGCKVRDEGIWTATFAGLPPGDESGWMWRTTESYVYGDDPTPRHHQRYDYNRFGDLTTTTANLSGSLPLDRFHEDSSKAVAPAPTNASAEGDIFVSGQSYDELGNLAFATGANHRCRSVSYDLAYADLATSESVFVGVPSAVSGCGAVELKSEASYDRGLELVKRVTDLHGEVTEMTYDGFGRPASVKKPDPDLIGALSPQPAATIEYLLSDVTGKPYSLIHTWRMGGASQATDTPATASYRESWAYVDGFGRTIVTLDQADRSAGDAGDWIANGLTEYDNKGAARRAYRAWFHSGDPAAFPLGTTPPTKYGRQRYDAFGRQIQTFNLDGTISLASVYHATSTDAWDAADLTPGPHYGTYASSAKDGHGRVVALTERTHEGKAIEARETRTAYVPSGEVAMITRTRVGHADPPVIRWIRYDSLGRMVLNVEPNTTKGFNPDPATDASTMKAWRYVYDDAGDLVGTSDARGCGSNYAYDSGGRLIAEDYSPCLDHQPAYSAPDLAAQTGIEVLYRYDEPDAEMSSSPANGCNPALFKGRLASVSDRASKTLTCFDGRGRVILVARKVARPGTPSDVLAERYANEWFSQYAVFDGADRPVHESTGAAVPELTGGDGKSEIVTHYAGSGAVRQVLGSYGVLVDHVTHDADRLAEEIQYGDVAGTKTNFVYDDRKRLLSVQTYRGPPAVWTASPPVYAPAPKYSGGAAPTTFQLLLENYDFAYDEVDNPVEIRDWRMPEEWPAGAKPVTRKMEYDDLYRLSRVTYEYKSGDDAWVSPFAPENAGTATNPRLATPSPQVSFDKRLLWQSFAYDWLGNTTRTDDDARGFYDRSIGKIANGTAAQGPYQLQSASNEDKAGPRTGHLSAAYDDAGNLVGLAVKRSGPCLPTGATCGQRFAYEWDEAGRLSRARRWDLANPGDAHDPLPGGTAAAELRYGYDSGDKRVLKTAVDAAGEARHTVYPLASVELRRAEWNVEKGEYSRTTATEVPYLFAHGVRLGRVSYEEVGVPTPGDGSRVHVILSLADHLGSAAISIDLGTSEVVERSTYQAYGGAESDYRPERWKAAREDYRFTGKEEDVEVGVQYFGFRYYAPAIQRWMSADPSAVHGMAADANVYAYVSGHALRATDPVGLVENEACQCEDGFKNHVEIDEADLSPAVRVKDGIAKLAPAGAMKLKDAEGLMKGPLPIPENQIAAKAVQPRTPDEMAAEEAQRAAQRAEEEANQKAAVVIALLSVPVVGPILVMGMAAPSDTSSAPADLELMADAIGAVGGLPSPVPAEESVAKRGVGGEVRTAVGGAGGGIRREANAAGGTIIVSDGESLGIEFAPHVSREANAGRSVNVLSGVHGGPSGRTTPAVKFFEADVKLYSIFPNVTVHNYSTLTPEQVTRMLEGPDVTVGAFCFSGVCLGR